MAQKSIPSINKSGYSMFWNSMWDDKNNFSKFLQKDIFIKCFINYFFLDFFQNKFVYFYNFNKINLPYINKKYNFNFLNKNSNYISIYLNNLFNLSIYTSKIWLFKYQNWIIIFLYVFTNFNLHLFNKKKNKIKNNMYLYNIINNYNFNLMSYNSNNNFLKKQIYCKNNF